MNFLSHAQAILGVDFPLAVTELESALSAASIPINAIIAGGGGEAKGTQRLRKSLAGMAWPKFTFTIVQGPAASAPRAPVGDGPSQQGVHG